MTVRPTIRSVAAGLAAATVALAGLGLPTVASAAPVTTTADALADKAREIPVVHPDGFARAIVAFERGTPAGTLDAMTDLGVVRGIELQAIDAVAVTATPAVLADVARLAGVTAVEPQRRIQLDLYASREQIDANGLTEPGSFTVNGITVDHDGLDGEGVGVAVIDSGVALPHPDMAHLAGGYHFSFSEIQDSGGISFEQWDPYVEATGPIALQDEIGHGTHVASTVGGTGDAADAQGAEQLNGVAPAATLYSMKITTAPFGIVEDLDFEEAALAAFDYTIRHHEELGIRITQNSWGLLPAEPDCLGLGCGEPTDFDGMAEMVQAVTDAGVAVIFSAGNDDDDPDGESTIDSFSDAGRAVTVAAACKTVDSNCDTETEAETGITDFSSRGRDDGTGEQVDVAAPGDTIMAALSPSILAPPPLNQCADRAPVGYFCISGTSMAAPHVSGVAALMYQANPDLTPGGVEDCLKATADDMGTPGVDQHSGHGMVNTRAAIACARTIGQAPTGPVVERLAGGDRYETAAAVALDAFDPAEVDTVYLAVGSNFPDALAGGPLAAAVDAPILLTETNTLPTVTRNALRSFSEATLLAAGEAADADETSRIAGDDRYGTAAEIAVNMQATSGEDFTTVFLVKGTDFPDALAGGPATDGQPILLTETDALPAATAASLERLGPANVTVIGGPGAVSDAVMAAAADAAGGADTERIQGDDRYATSANVAATLGDVTTVYVSVGTNFPDALAGSSAAVANGAPIVLTARDVLPAPTRAYLEGLSAIERLVILGGPQAVDEDVYDELEALVTD